MGVAVIADIVGSRLLRDRSGAQKIFDDIVARVEADIPLAVEPLHATVGDELQARYSSLGDALASLLLVQLGLPDGHDLRFGIGVGEIRQVDSDAARLQDGPGWWAARSAIEIVHARQQRAVPTSRTWIVGGPEEDDGMHAAIDLANAYVLARDEIVAGMTGRVRRLTYGRCLHRTQAALAAKEGISQSAVSQALQTAGSSAVVMGFEALRGRGSA
ncbi:hypothetical protein J2Y69_001775 [Microbacterium resistens]|uniref:SatD family (SatD) n=1 Tax=Microbacterium resistens TaxID=156977 RepID=A0ABU1SC59_9MICO|nr:SatD family protein [Microbacterium resistens]MDR6867176.1 hypothetical protein [Microbacterium resistens]